MTLAPRLVRLASATVAVGVLVAPVLVLAPAGAAEPTWYGSCADVRSDLPDAVDGEYQITVFGQRLSVWCADLATTPSEYLTLAQTGPMTNVAQSNPNNGTFTSTSYARLGLVLPAAADDPFLVRVTDRRFATTTGPGDVDYASAGGCGFASARMNVDLSGTPFALDPSTIEYWGYLGQGDLTSSPDDKVHDVPNARGDCGGRQVVADAQGRIALEWDDDVVPVVTDPADASVASGDDAAFASTATGGTAVRWQTSTDGAAWADTPDATGTTFTLAGLTRVDDGLQVRAVWTNAAGDAPTRPALVSVAASVPVVSDPEDANVTSGDDAIFDVTVTGDPAPTLQWQVSADGGAWSDLADETGTELVLTDATTADDGLSVRVVATNETGPVVSAAASLTVEAAAPVVVSAPQAATVTEGGDATFGVGATGDPAPSVRWQTSRDGDAWTDLAGETGDTLVLAGVGREDDGLLVRAFLENAGGTLATDAVRLTVVTPLVPPVTTPVTVPLVPVTVPVVTVPVSAPATSTVDVVVVDLVVDPAVVAGTGSLARTGTDPFPLTALGALLVLGGGALVAGTRRREPAR